MSAISVIIPVYNTKKYLRACLESVLAQSDAVAQIIIVDDGSSDGSAEMAETFARRFPVIELYRRDNAGVAAARNFGLSRATGDYVMFVDSDDLLPQGAVKKLRDALEADRAEIAVGMFEAFSRTRTWIHESMRVFEGMRRSETNLDALPELIGNLSPWNKLFRRDFIVQNDLSFPEGVSIREDIYFVCNAFYRAERVSIIPETVYRYRARDEQGVSLTSRITCDVVHDTLSLSDRLDADEARFGIGSRSQVRYLRYVNELHALCYRFWPLVQQSRADASLYDQMAAFLAKAGTPVIMSETIEKRPALYDLKIGEYARARRLIMSQQMVALSRMKQIKRKLLTRVKESIWAIVPKVLPLMRTFVKVPPGLWLIGEQHGDGADDTGGAFFRYCREHHPNRPIYFVTKARNIKGLGDDSSDNVVAYGSLRHFLFALQAEVFVFSDGYKDVCAHWHYVQQWRGRPFSVFLQHGVFAFKRSAYYRAEEVANRGERYDLIVVSSTKERDYVARDFGYDSETFAVTGLSRFDRLYGDRHRPRNRTILFVPTWRYELRYASEQAYLASDFYRGVEALTRHPLLLALLEKTGYSMLVCFHHASKRFTGLHRSQSPNIRYTDMTRTDLYAAVVESPLLITDYSSAAFNTAFLQRPVIFYQFDREAFLTVEGGSFIDYDRDLFGMVSADPAEIVEEIEYNIEHAFTRRDEDAVRAERFFAYRDDKNSERIYEAIHMRLRGKE